MVAPPLDADQYRYSRLSGRNGADAAVCFGGANGIRMPYEAEDGTWVSSLNGLVESFNGPDGRCATEGICSLRIVIDAKTTLNFPLSNRIVNASDVLNESGYATFDVDSPGRITVTGFGRMTDGNFRNIPKLLKTRASNFVHKTYIDIRPRDLKKTVKCFFFFSPSATRVDAVRHFFSMNFL